MNYPLRLPPLHLLACPRCGADCDGGLNPEHQRCDHCGQEFFGLAGMPCWFSTGKMQLTLWQSLYGIALQQAEKNFLIAEQEIPTHDLLPRARARMQLAQQANRQIIEDVKDLLSSAGLEAKIAPEFANYDASRMLQYFELLLRDWAWDAAVSPTENENHRELNRVRQAVKNSPTPLGHTLVMGAGAGRLSWDIHCELNPSSTIALDTNPVLISAAHRLIARQKPWQLTEVHPNPQIDHEPIQRWTLAANGETEKASSWYALAANAWSPPLKPGSIDTLITPWFIDVNGKEIRILIAQVQKLLKPGGLWINTGPLLYGTDISPMRRYTKDEIRELAGLAGFEFLYENVENTPYLKTPLSAQVRTEQIWTFCARAPQKNQPLQVSNPPAWILLPHLSIPKLNIPLPQDPTLQHLLSLVDGYRSINDIAELIAPNLDNNQDPVHLVQAVFVEYLLQR
jgi:N2227-like protein.